METAATRILVVGVDGMLGRSAFRILGTRSHVELWGTTRRPASLDRLGPRVLRVDARDPRPPHRVLEEVRPHSVLNCVGALRGSGISSEEMHDVNAEFPHRLVRAAEGVGARVIHISTDAVFSGRSGPYDERSPTDPTDEYGRSKLEGEVRGEPHLTVRTSIIGRNESGTGLVEWAIRHRGTTVDGHARSLWSGVTADELVRLLGPQLEAGTSHGVVHVRAEALSKADLLRQIDAALGLDLTVRDVDEPVVDRRLRSVRADLRLSARPIAEQLDALAATGGT